MAASGHWLLELPLWKSPLRPCRVLDAPGVPDDFVFAVLIVSGDFVLHVLGVPDGLALDD